MISEINLRNSAFLIFNIDDILKIEFSIEVYDMFTYTGDYIEHIDDNKSDFKYYTFAPRPLMYGDMYKIDNKLCSLLIETHRNIGFLEGLQKYAPNKDAFSELMLLKECAHSLMIDYDSVEGVVKEILLQSLIFNWLIK